MRLVRPEESLGRDDGVPETCITRVTVLLTKKEERNESIEDK